VIGTKRKNAVVIRSKVELKKNYSSYRDILRFDFWYSCAYCSMTEIEAFGVGFDIDHYYPQKNHPNLINDYNNLMWSCQICNRYKSDFDPDVNHIAKGNVVLRPDEDDPSQHIQPDKFTLKGKTQTGEFNIQLLDLNRKQLRRLREIRERLSKAKEFVAFGIRTLVSLHFDRLHPKKRPIFLKIKKEVLERNKRLFDSADELIREFARSPLLNDDPEKKARLKRRKKYLRDQNAITIQ